MRKRISVSSVILTLICCAILFLLVFAVVTVAHTVSVRTFKNQFASSVAFAQNHPTQSKVEYNGETTQVTARNMSAVYRYLCSGKYVNNAEPLETDNCLTLYFGQDSTMFLSEGEGESLYMSFTSASGRTFTYKVQYFSNNMGWKPLIRNLGLD